MISSGIYNLQVTIASDESVKKYINNISYFVMDKEKTKELVKNKLVDNSSEETTTQSNTAN